MCIDGIDPDTFPNIGYLTSGYDIYQGNPHSTNGLDPGFKTRQLFELTYEDNWLTDDRKNLIPDHTTVLRQPSCYLTFSTTTITEEMSYHQSLAVDASVSGSGWGASFSASSDYKSVKDRTTNRDYRYYSSQASCTIYAASIHYMDAKLAGDFVRAVADLSSEEEYYRLIDTYGTHFAKQITMGGRYGYISKMSTLKALEMNSEGINVKASAGYSAIFSVDGSSSVDTEHNQAQQFNDARENVKEFFVGGGPQGEQWSAYKWAESLAPNPLPIKYQLESIDSLLTTSFFPDVDDIADKQRQLREAMTNYCKQLTKNVYCGKEPAPAPLLLIVKTITKFTKLAPMYKIMNIQWLMIFNQLPLAGFFWIPQFSDPSMRMPGMLTTFTNDKAPSSSFAIIDPPPNSPTIRKATSWTINQVTNIISNLKGGDHITPPVLTHRPECPEGFLSVSDFFCPDTHLSDCSDVLPQILPCFAEHCLTTCRTTPVDLGLVALYYDGFPQLGANYDAAGSSFFRSSTPLPTGQQPCLSTTCLDY